MGKTPPQKYSDCPAEITVAVIGGRWKIFIIWELFTGVQRFSALRRSIPGITQKMLAQQLRELERDRLIFRSVYAEVPPRVEYTLTDLGESLKPIIDAMCIWGEAQRAISPKDRGMPTQ